MAPLALKVATAEAVVVPRTAPTQPWRATVKTALRAAAAATEAMTVTAVTAATAAMAPRLAEMVAPGAPGAPVEAVLPVQAATPEAWLSNFRSPDNASPERDFERPRLPARLGAGFSHH